MTTTILVALTFDEPPVIAYDRLCEILHPYAGSVVEYNTEQYFTDKNPEPRDTEELFGNAESRKVFKDGASNRHFYVRVVRVGDSYGAGDSLIYTALEPSVEFYDYDQDLAKFGPRGQFVARYYRSTLVEHEEGYGLDLLTYVPEWKVSAATMTEILNWLKEV
jgi:hypothetical protein